MRLKFNILAHMQKRMTWTKYELRLGLSFIIQLDNNSQHKELQLNICDQNIFIFWKRPKFVFVILTKYEKV